MKKTLPFLITISLLSAAILGIVYQSGWSSVIPSYAMEMVVLLAVTTGVIFFYLLQWSSSRPQLFVQFYLLSIAVKIAAYGAFVAVVVINDPPMAVANSILFLVSYVLFTFLEVLFLFSKVNKS